MTLVRQIVACLALALALFAFVGCGEESLEGPKISQQTADELIDKLDDVKTNIDEGDCEGTGSAPSALAAVQKSIDAQADEIGPDIVAGLRELLGNVDAQVSQFCSEQADTSDADATTDSTTESTTETETSTETTESTTESTSTDDTHTDPEQPQTPPQGNGPDGSGPPGKSDDEGDFETEGGGIAPRGVAAPGGGSR